MANDDNLNTDTPAGPEPVDPTGRHEVDRYLRIMTFVGAGFDITLTIGGLLVSGTIITQVEFFRLTIENLRKQLEEGDETTPMIQWFEEDLQKSQDAATNKRLETTEIIHLKNAVITLGRSVVIPGFSLWRGRLSRIDGFSLGRLGDSEPSNDEV